MTDIERLHRLIKKAKKINAWRERTLHNLLTKVAPKIAAMHDGYNYVRIQTLGNVLFELALPFQPCMNWLKKNEEEEIGYIITKVKVEHLIKGLN
jgi:hypothetical protein